MSEWAVHLDNPFALSGFAALLLVGLALQIAKSKGKLDAVRGRLVTTASYILALIGIGGLIVALLDSDMKQANAPGGEGATTNEVRTNSPSFGNVGGDVQINYSDNED